MTIKEIHITEYDSHFNEFDALFLTASYYLANTSKQDIENIKCFVGTYQDQKIGILGLIDNQQFMSPYRAPFGGIRTNSKLSFAKIKIFIEAFQEKLSLYEIKKINITLAPTFYNVTQISTLHNILIFNNFKLKNTELNQYFNLQYFNTDVSYLNEKDKKNTTLALKRNLRFEITKDSEKQKQLYNLLVQSRSERNIPLKLSWEQLYQISVQINSDYWLIYTPNNELCAGAVIYHINSEIVQIIYWGFATAFSELDSMRYLSFEIFNHYKNIGKKIVDIGISTENSIPNEGLVAFKENIGCDACLKYDFEKIIPEI